jgi:small subunit ribosomal protein S8
MSHDSVADTLNKIMNAKKRNKNEVVATIYSKLLIKILELAKSHGYIKHIGMDGKKIRIEVSENLNKCGVVKPRFFVKKEDIDKYMRRYLPARDFGFLIVSTNKGLMTHKEAMEKGIGGCLVAYFY